MTITEIPYEVFFNYVVPHLEVKELGLLSLSSKILREFCEDNDVWREMYLRTIRCVITDKSVHISRNDSRFKAVQSEACTFEHPYPKTSPWRHPDSIVDSDGLIPYYSMPCLPREIRDLIRHPDPSSVNNLRGVYRSREEKKKLFMDRYKFTMEIQGIWKSHNRERALSTVNLCQCARHYRYETLGVPDKCRGSKCYKAMVLSKLRTIEKHKCGPIRTELKQKQVRMEEIQSDIRLLQKKLDNLKDQEQVVQRKYERRHRVTVNLSSAITSIRERVNKKNIK